MPGHKTRYIYICIRTEEDISTRENEESRGKGGGKKHAFVPATIISTFTRGYRDHFRSVISFIRLHPLRLIEPHTSNAFHNERTATRVRQIYLLDLRPSSPPPPFVPSCWRPLPLNLCVALFIRGNAIEIIKK